MAQITAYYKMYLPAGHHRQPRNANSELDLAPASGGATPFTPPFFPQLPYNLPNNGGNGMAKLLFWSDTDGTTGVIRPPQAFNIPSAATARTVTGWYFPVSGPGGPGGGTAIIDDAFSAKLGRFIDDTFVDVTSDPSLTANANVIGVVPTTKKQTLVAKANVQSTTEPFSQWVLNDALMPVGDASLHVAKGTNGIAIAVYQQGEFARPQFFDFAESVKILFGVIQDGGGGTTGGPVGPWDPLITALIDSRAIAARAVALDRKIGTQVTSLAAQDAVGALRIAVKKFEELAKGQK